VIIAGGVPARPALAQRESGPAIRANRISDPIVMDGLLNEESWMRAEVLEQFLQKDPEEGSPATELTEVRILYDARHIYFGITCLDSNPSGIRATELRRDNELNNDDSFELVLDTFVTRSCSTPRTAVLGKL
jgi:hypothetical protein